MVIPIIRIIITTKAAARGREKPKAKNMKYIAATSISHITMDREITWKRSLGSVIILNPSIN